MELSTQNEIVNPASLNQDIELTATIPIEMINAQQQLIVWCDGKLKALRFESAELNGATEHAKKMKWKFSTLQSQYNKSVKRIQYYEKIKAALLEGYYIIPNFPIDMFAIRTTRTHPSTDKFSKSYWATHRQDAQELLIDNGEYKNPLPVISRVNHKTADGKDDSYSYPTNFDDFEFPVTMARPRIMEATTQAMALKIFDRIGIMPQRKDKDPVIIGQVIHKSGNGERLVSFMIAWHLNTKVL